MKCTGRCQLQVTSCRGKFSKRKTKTRGRSKLIMAFIFEDEIIRDCSPFLHTLSFLSFLGGSFIMFTIRKKKKKFAFYGAA